MYALLGSYVQGLVVGRLLALSIVSALKYLAANAS